MNIGEFLRARPGIALAVPAGALAVLVITAALNFDQRPRSAAADERLKDAQSLLSPRTATAEELERAGGSLSEQSSIRLEAGAWVQVADGTGRLAQQYSAARLEPMPESRLRMTEPRARMFQRDGRVLTLAARSGLVHVPRRALEAGALEGDVVIRLYKPVDGRAVDVLRDAPAIVVNATQAQFDGVSGEVRCDDAVRIETDVGSFAGQGLSLVLDSDGEGIESLVVERALEPIRIDRSSRAIAEKRRARVSTNSAIEPGDASAASPAASKPADPRFYRLHLLGGVEVVRTRGGATSTVRGDELIAVFSLDAKGLGEGGLDAISFAPLRRGIIPVGPTTLALLAHAGAPLALQQTTPGSAPARNAGDSDSVVVSFGGRLEMTPVTDSADQLASPEDMRFDVLGRRVELVDSRNGSRIECARLRYGVRDQSVDAEGRDGAPIKVSTRRMTLEAKRFTAVLSRGTGRIEGAGRMQFSRGSARDAAWLELVPSLTPDIARMLVSSDPSAVALVLDPPVIDTSVSDSPGATSASGGDQELSIRWDRGVDLRFTGPGDNARISGARFEGAVEVVGRQFSLASQSLDVAFDVAPVGESDGESPGGSEGPNGRPRERIEAIVAEGAVRARQVGASGALAAERIELILGADARGDSLPQRLVARGAVEATDARQTVWTEDLIVQFAEKKSPATDDAARTAQRLGDVDVAAVEAKGGVQVLLGGGRGEGTRIFADALAGDGIARRIALAGADLSIARSNTLADGLREIRFDEAARTAHSDGPGRFRAFRAPIIAGEGRLQRPAVDDPQSPVPSTLVATWNDALDYAEPQPTRSVLDVRGEVRMRSRPSDAASDAVDAESVSLEFGPQAAGAGGDRALERFVALGAARIESLAWKDGAREGEPRVFRVNGDRIEYDLRTREGLVEGAGGLLVNMPAGAPRDPGTTGAGLNGISLGSEGASRFNWKTRMKLERIASDRYLMRMEDGVELKHAGAAANDTLSMNCNRLEATVRRSDETKRSEPAQSAPNGVDLGGPAELLAVKGSGGVFIRTPSQDIECGEFDYSVERGVAVLRGRQDRPVTVLLSGNPTPIQAQEIEWDLRAGRLEIRKPLVTGGR